MPGAEGIPGQTLRMHADEWIVSLDIAIHQGHLFVRASTVQVADSEKIAVYGGQSQIHHSFDNRWADSAAGHAITFCHAQILSG